MKHLNLPLFLLVLLTGVVLATLALLRLELDTDIVRSLPAQSVAVSDALEIFEKSPIHDSIAVDIALAHDAPETLIESGRTVETMLRESGFFREVGNSNLADQIPKLAGQIVETLPLLLSAEELDTLIAPRLEPTFIAQRLQESLTKLSGLEGIGQAQLIAKDPLGFMEPVMAKLTLLSPFHDTQIDRGFLLSADRKHLLVTARPHASGTDTASARELQQLLSSIEAALNEQYREAGNSVTLTPVGAYRAALDNERIIRHDVNFALILSLLGIGLLLFTAFPRPLVGLLSLLPALFGTATALFVFSLFYPTISIMVLGFGGAIISITVDHGIAYLLFLDRQQQSLGKDASHEVRSIGALAVLTTSCAFLTLSFSGFPVFVQLGQFTAMGLVFSFLFVHYVFPHILPVMEAAKSRRLPLQSLVDTLYSTGRPGAIATALLAVILIFYAKPQFQVSMESMNTVSKETVAADAHFARVWGSVTNEVILMVSADSVENLQQQSDQLLAQIGKDVEAAVVEEAFVPSMLFPGKARAVENLAAWKGFWNRERLTTLEATVNAQAEALGFATNAFKGFFNGLAAGSAANSVPLSSSFFPLLGIEEGENGRLHAFIKIKPGDHYDSAAFFSAYHGSGKIFDSPYFSKQLADILFQSFARMLAIIAISIVVFLLLFYASWQLTLITLLPPLFSYICTLGTMQLIGHPLDIPGLMLSIVILGMGIDYSIFFVRAHQRYRDPLHPSFGLIRMAVFMAGCSTLIGFGVLCFAEHSLLRSIGITSGLGIGYALLGAFLLLPPIVETYFSKGARAGAATDSIAQRVRKRYRLLEAYPRMFARFKLKTDPMFVDLPGVIGDHAQRVQMILDIGCGYGVPGCWCLELCEKARLVGLDPDVERIRVANLAMGSRGTLLPNPASDLPELEQAADLVLLLDMLHYLDDTSLQKLFYDCYKRMAAGGVIVIRYVIYPEKQRVSWFWKVEDRRTRAGGGAAHYRSRQEMAAFLTAAGFCVETDMITATNQELVWLTGRVEK